MRSVPVIGVLCVATALVLAALAVTGRTAYDDHRRSRDRAAVESVARDAVRTLISVSADRTGALRNLEPSLTGAFLTQFRAMFGTFTGVLTQGDVSSSGTVQAEAVATLTTASAQVLVAAHARVRASKVRANVRDYRFRVDLTHVGGGWKISGMELVP